MTPRTRLYNLGLLLLAGCLVALVPAAPALADDCTDGDGDGYVTCSGCDAGGNTCGDCDDSDGAVHPGATEVCNGQDDDCDGDTDLADSAFDDPDPVDDIDNDGDGDLDEGFGYCVYFQSGPADECKTGGRLECRFPAEAPTQVTPFGTLSCVNLTNNVITWADETTAAGNCEDGVNNDCDTGGADGVDNDHDGFIDEADEAGFDLSDVHDPACQTAEVCDEKDNDGDDQIDEGFSVGALCSAGQGVCEHSGTVGCLPDGTSACGATPGVPKNEGASFGNSCDDAKDNDCDGLTDLGDPDCAGFGDPELCGNGTDDDGDGVIDEGFPQVGQPCAAGVGACAALGQIACTADGTGVQCGATAGSPPEATEATCDDAVDNDCDGSVDGADPDCAASFADLGVTCSLPYERAKPGDDCTGWHVLTYGASEGGVTLKADLLALAADGSLQGIIENVQNGQAAHLASRTEAQDFKVASVTRNKDTRHTVFAPMPLLRVTGTKGGIEDVAYCGILPYLEVTAPDNVTLSLSESSSLAVGGFLPLVDSRTVGILLNGVEILAAAGIDPATSFPTASPLCTAPGDCVFQMEAGCGDGTLVDVEIRNVQVQAQSGSGGMTAREAVATALQVNTFSFEVLNLPPGGHIFQVTGTPLPLPANLSPMCDRDDLTDTGIASAFGIQIDSPTEQQVVASAPVTVAGTVCGGNEISSLRINGRSVDVTVPTHQTCTAGNGTTEAAECVVNFSEPIEETDLHEAVAGTAAGGTFHRGSNRVIADASDNQGHRTFNNDVVFALGPVQSPAGSLAAAAAPGIAGAVGPAFHDVLDTITSEIDPAFVVGLKESAAQDFFNEKCVGAIEEFSAQTSARLSGRTFGTLDAEPGCSCDLNNVPIVLEAVDFTPSAANPTCAVDFQSGQIKVKVNLPDIRIQVGAHRSCTTRGLFGECLARTKIDVTAVTHVKNLSYEFVITADSIQNKTAPPEDLQVFSWTVVDNNNDPLFLAAGTCSGGPTPGRECFGDTGCGGGTCAGVVKNAGDGAGQFNAVTSNNSGIECWGAAVCSVFQFIGAGLIEIFTLGFADGAEIVDIIDFDFDFEEGFEEEVAASEPDPMSLDEVEIDPDKVSSFGHAMFTPGDISVVIENGGLTLAFPASFETQVVDPTNRTTPGASVTEASAPTVGAVVAAGDEVSVLIADDVFNQVFASMKASGAITGFCTDEDALTVNDLLPDAGAGGCDSLGDDTTIAGATVQGICHAIRGATCTSLTGGLPNVEIGACAGFSGDDCTVLPFAAKLICNATPTRDIHADDSVVLCARQDLEPRLLFSDDDASDHTVLTDLILNDTNVVLLIDKGNDGYAGQLESLQGCFGAEGDAAPDCLLYAVCLDLTLKTTMGIDNSQCAANETGFVFSLNEVLPSGIQSGVMCSAATPTDDTLVTEAGFGSKAVETLSGRAEAFTPPFCAEGLTLGGVLDFTSAGAKLFAITTDGGTGFADFLGITGALGPPAP